MLGVLVISSDDGISEWQLLLPTSAQHSETVLYHVTQKKVKIQNWKKYDLHSFYTILTPPQS